MNRAAIAFCLLLPDASLAQTIAPGEYITEGGWGVLKIEPAAKGAQAFSIDALGGNLFSCGLNGDIRNGRARLDGEGPRKPCEVRFTRKGEALDVTSNDFCSVHCGAHASFPGLYLRVAPICTGDSLKKSREAFKVQYDRKDYAGSRALLEPIVKQCARTLDRFTGGWILNDLAITQYRLGDLSACTQTLRPLQKDAAKSNEDLTYEYGAMDAERYLPVIRAARTNLKLCSGASRRR